MARLSGFVRNLAVYGLGDVATNLVSFLLLPVYVRHLSTTDYGIIGLLLGVEAMAKIVFRFGLDASFMRLFFDCPDARARQRLASTIFLFLAATGLVVLLPALGLASWLAEWLFGVGGYTLVFQLTLVNIFVMGFSFIPFHVMRIEGRSGRFTALSFSRSFATLVVRLWLVVGLGMGVLGVVVADILVSVVVTAVLAPRYAELLRPVFSRPLLREALAFGLPRLPHGLAHQVIAVADRYVLRLFVPLADIGVYAIGTTFGLAMKLFLSAFEYAWAPFYFATMKEDHAKATFRRVTTWGVMVLVWLAAGLSAMAADVVRLMTVPAFYGAADVIPWVALGVLLQGVYLLTSIGLNITKNTKYYPVSTGLAAAASVSGNLLLVPHLGIVGAACSNAIAYGVLAGSAFWFAQRVYPMKYDLRRLAMTVVAGLGAYGLAVVALPADVPALWGAIGRGSVVAVAYPALLFVMGFGTWHDLVRLAGLLPQVATGGPGRRPASAPERETMSSPSHQAGDTPPDDRA